MIVDRSTESKREVHRPAGSVAAGNTGKGLSRPAVPVRQQSGLQSPPLQRILITPGDPLANGKEIDDIMRGFSDINLAIGSEMTLDVDFGVAEDAYATTSLWMDGIKVVPQHALIPANKDRAWVIRIILSGETYGTGQNRDTLGSLYATLVHEWELHGRQHALNIHALKQGRIPDALFDHGGFFVEGTTGLDRGMAGAMEDEELAPAIAASYRSDIAAHTGFNLRGWTEQDPAKARDFVLAMSRLKASFKILKAIKPNSAQAAYAGYLAKFFDDCFKDAYFDAVDESELSAEYIAFNLRGNPDEAYSLLIGLYAMDPPGGEEDLFRISCDMLKPDFRSLLLSFPGFVSAWKTTEGAGKKYRTTALKGLRQ